MEKKVQEHDIMLNSEILPRVEILESKQESLEKSQLATSQEVQALRNDLLSVQKGQVQLEKGQKELELTMVKEGEANRKIMNENKDLSNRLLDHVLKKDEKETEVEEEAKKRKDENEAKLKSQKWEIIGKVGSILVGSGGILYVILQSIQ
ncbi:hypothetical protein [Bacillus sp. mrc49]|uniref:hypothetical protein n=1 Tax=Bacillus sp. mrc49 TaxID=2054913 RepID=UPI000C27AACE|nr:hypothetical protein [Bacillus sp. mrc49]PJN90998.1 hypothetical protein CVN76_07355 [Bacillus sp. mrc49]